MLLVVLGRLPDPVEAGVVGGVVDGSARLPVAIGSVEDGDEP